MSGGKALTKEGLTYGDYTLSFTVPAGYTADSTVKALKLTTANNSKNTVNITLTAIPPTPSESPSSDISDESSSSVSNSEATNADPNSALTSQNG